MGEIYWYSNCSWGKCTLYESHCLLLPSSTKSLSHSGVSYSLRFLESYSFQDFVCYCEVILMLPWVKADATGQGEEIGFYSVQMQEMTWPKTSDEEQAPLPERMEARRNQRQEMRDRHPYLRGWSLDGMNLARRERFRRTPHLWRQNDNVDSL